MATRNAENRSAKNSNLSTSVGLGKKGMKNGSAKNSILFLIVQDRLLFFVSP